jgi:hypothetical protein
MNIENSMVEGTGFGCKRTVETVQSIDEDMGLSQTYR